MVFMQDVSKICGKSQSKSPRGLVATAEGLEQNPDSAGRRETLKEELAATKADADEEIVAAAQALLDAIKTLPGGEQTINQTVTGDHNIFSGSGNITINRS